MNRISLFNKIVGAFLIVSCTSSLIEFYSNLSSQKVISEFVEIAQVEAPKSLFLSSLKQRSMELFSDLTLIANPIISQEVKKGISQSLDDSRKRHQEISDRFNEVKKTSVHDQQIVEEIEKNWKALNGKAGEVLSLFNEDYSKNAVQISKMVINDIKPLLGDYNEKIDTLANKIQKNASFANEKANRDHQFSDHVSLILNLLSTLFFVLFGVFFAKSISRKINRAIEYLNHSSQKINRASSNVASSSSRITETAIEQKNSLVATATALEEIGAMTQRASESAKTTSINSNESKNKAINGKASMNEMTAAMDEISLSNDSILNQINISNQQMVEIVKVIQEIGDKTKIINDIVFQTKLLSFNASVEAARAGEHGKGFAVVAEEVGNLAQMSGNAAKEIAEMLSGSIKKVEGIVDETKSKVESLIAGGKTKVNSGIEVAQKCAVIFTEIVDDVSKVAELAGQILNASQEQAVGVAEINKTVRSLDLVFQQNATTSQESSSMVGELTNQAQSLNSIVNELTMVVNGNKLNQDATRILDDSNNNQFFNKHENKPDAKKNITNVISFIKPQPKSNSLSKKTDVHLSRVPDLKNDSKQSHVKSGVSSAPSNKLSIAKQKDSAAKSNSPSASNAKSISANDISQKENETSINVEDIESVPDYNHPGFKEI